jgi:hypothetical protein
VGEFEQFAGPAPDPLFMLDDAEATVDALHAWLPAHGWGRWVTARGAEGVTVGGLRGRLVAAIGAEAGAFFDALVAGAGGDRDRDRGRGRGKGRRGRGRMRWCHRW